MDPDAYKNHITRGSSFQGKPIITDQIGQGGLQVVWRELEKVLQQDVDGHVVELGCYAGTTSLFMRRLLDQHAQSARREFHVYDSFAGLPAKQQQDQSAAGTDFAAGKLAVSKQQFIKNFQAASLQLPAIHKCWFDDITASDIPARLAFAFLDGDFYGSILTSLKLVWPRMQPGGAVLIDDYKRESLPGVERAIHDFFHGNVPPLRAEHNIAVIIKP